MGVKFNFASAADRRYIVHSCHFHSARSSSFSLDSLAPALDFLFNIEHAVRNHFFWVGFIFVSLD